MRISDWSSDVCSSDLVAIQQEQLAQQSMAESLILHNDAAVVEEQHDLLYYSMLQIGDGDSQPGAELNAYWYMRNAKMFAKLDLFAQPGDRVLVIVGSGHATWRSDAHTSEPQSLMRTSY